MSAEENPPQENEGEPRPNPYEQKQAARRARLENAAERAGQKSLDLFSSASATVAMIPFGQPILVGHHSEKRHRGDLRRHDAKMRKGIEAQKEAEELQHRAAAVGKGGISSDDPEAVNKLKRKLDQLIARRDRMKALNALFRKQGTLHDTDFLDDVERQAILRNMGHSWRKGIPCQPWELQNIGARIRDVKQRITRLEARANRPEVEPETIGLATVMEDREENRVLLTFPARLSKEDYDLVRSFGFLWSRTRKAFVRKLNDSALDAGRTVARQIAEKQGNA